MSWAMVEMVEPYIPGFLAFREVGFLLKRLEVVKHDCPHFTPQVSAYLLLQTDCLKALVIFLFGPHSSNSSKNNIITLKIHL